MTQLFELPLTRQRKDKQILKRDALTHDAGHAFVV